MAYYRECPDCGCNLDPGEKCECQKEKALSKHGKKNKPKKKAISA